MPTRLGDYQVNATEAAAKVAARFAERGDAFGEHGDINATAAAAILRMRA